MFARHLTAQPPITSSAAAYGNIFWHPFSTPDLFTKCSKRSPKSQHFSLLSYVRSLNLQVTEPTFAGLSSILKGFQFLYVAFFLCLLVVYILMIVVCIYSFTGEEVMFVHCIDASGNCYRGETRSFADTVAHVAGIVDRCTALFCSWCLLLIDCFFSFLFFAEMSLKFVVVLKTETITGSQKKQELEEKVWRGGWGRGGGGGMRHGFWGIQYLSLAFFSRG